MKYTYIGIQAERPSPFKIIFVNNGQYSMMYHTIIEFKFNSSILQ